MSSVEGIEPRSRETDRACEPHGIGGWLLLVAVLQVAGLFKLFFLLAKTYQDPENLSGFTQYPLGMYGELAFNLLIVLLAVSTILFFFVRSRYFPPFFIVQIVAALVIPVLSAGWTAFAISLQFGAPFSELFEFERTDWTQLAVAAVQALIGIPYVLRSKRVKNTFDGRDPAQQTKLLIVLVFVVAAFGAVALYAGLLHATVRGAFSGQLLGGLLQIALAVWLYRGSDIARTVLAFLYALGFLFAIGLAFFSVGGGQMIAVLSGAMAIVTSVIFWVLAFSKRLRAELAINEARYRKPELETA
jgi:hypothetical protein